MDVFGLEQDGRNLLECQEAQQQHAASALQTQTYAIYLYDSVFMHTYLYNCDF